MTILSWLFSGIGASIAIGLAGYLIRHWLKKGTGKLEPLNIEVTKSTIGNVNTATNGAILIQSQAALGAVTINQALPSSSSPNLDTKLLTISPKAVLDSIEQLPLYLQKENREHYKGRTVKWHATLFSVDKQDDPRLVHTAYRSVETNRSDYVVLFGTVRIDAFPDLKFAKAKDPVLLTGQIQDLNALDIVLKIKQIEFLPKSDTVR